MRPAKERCYKPGVGKLRPAAPSAYCSSCMTRLVALYFMNLPSLEFLALNTYEVLLTRKPTDCRILGFRYEL